MTHGATENLLKVLHCSLKSLKWVIVHWRTPQECFGVFPSCSERAGCDTSMSQWQPAVLQWKKFPSEAIMLNLECLSFTFTRQFVKSRKVFFFFALTHLKSNRYSTELAPLWSPVSSCNKTSVGRSQVASSNTSGTEFNPKTEQALVS